MGDLKLWTVSDIESDYIVIASSVEEAFGLAVQAGLEVDPDRKGEATEMEPGTGLRWVGFDSDSDAIVQMQELLDKGVEPTRVRARATLDGLARPLLWEVGARDADWIRLGAGYLCGGGE